MPFDFSMTVVSWWCIFHMLPSSLTGFPCSSAAKESSCNVGDLGLTPGLGKSPGEGKRLNSVQFTCSVVSDSLCPMDCSTPGLPLHHQLPEFTQTHVHRVGNAIQPSHLLLSPSSPAFNHSQHQGLFKWVSSLHQVAKGLQFQLQTEWMISPSN